MDEHRSLSAQGRAGARARTRLVRALLLGNLLAWCGAAAGAGVVWPTVALPKDAVEYSLGEPVTVNGTPMRMHGFVSPAKPFQVAQWLRASLGRPLVENTQAGKLILGRAEGEHYISIQLVAAGGGTRGVVAVSHLRAGYDKREASRAAAARLLSRLPAGSRLLSEMLSSDGGKQSSHTVITNTHNEELNRARLVDMLRGDGLALEGAAAPGSGATLFFKGGGKEAMAVIARDGAGNTTVVLNIITTMEHFK